jgi:hypothetical protein
MGFFSSLFGGSNPTLSGGIKQSGQMAGWGQSQGEGLSTAAGNFFSGLLPGNAAQTARLLAPQIKTQQQQAQQAKQTMAQFGNRSGGTNAKAQTIDDTARANIGDMISKLTGQAATGAADIGKSMLDTSIASLNNQMQFSQQQMQNWSDSILGKGITTAVSAGETYALGGGGGGDAAAAAAAA